jgi:hypothetical protein
MFAVFCFISHWLIDVNAVIRMQLDYAALKKMHKRCYLYLKG